MKFNLKLLILLVIITNLNNHTQGQNYLYILNDKNIQHAYIELTEFFENSEYTVIKDVRGVIIRFYTNDILKEYQNLSDNTLKKIFKIEYFLAKIKNPVIIEVHTENLPKNKIQNLKNWEISTVIAKQIESNLTLPKGKIEKERVDSVGYGEFMPSKNTPNNGGKNTGRVDIIVLYNIIGE